MTRARTTRFFPDQFSPAIYTRGNGQAAIVWDADAPPGRYTEHAIRSTIVAFAIVAGLRRHDPDDPEQVPP